MDSDDDFELVGDVEEKHEVPEVNQLTSPNSELNGEFVEFPDWALVDFDEIICPSLESDSSDDSFPTKLKDVPSSFQIINFQSFDDKFDSESNEERTKTQTLHNSSNSELKGETDGFLLIDNDRIRGLTYPISRFDEERNVCIVDLPIGDDIEKGFQSTNCSSTNVETVNAKEESDNNVVGSETFTIDFDEYFQFSHLFAVADEYEECLSHHDDRAGHLADAYDFPSHMVYSAAKCDRFGSRHRKRCRRRTRDYSFKCPVFWQ